jgi:hypothetical protein
MSDSYDHDILVSTKLRGKTEFLHTFSVLKCYAIIILS